jgi:GAF domain-containing protein
MCRALILDDDLFFAETIKLILEDEEEAQPEVATSAEDAVEKVAQAIRKNKPYDILLIDHRLGPGKDGIEVFKELRAISPDSDGIIFTGYEDPESGLLAYEADAFRYMPKTANNREILFVFRALRQWRKERREHNWQKIFSEVMEASIREKDFHNVARAIVRHSLNLGFSRAHLFWTPTGHEANADGRMLGIRGAGDGRIGNFKSRLFPLGEWVDVEALQKVRNTVSLRDEELEKVSTSMQASGYQPPASEVTILPLFSADRLMGLLMLDYAQENKLSSEHERGWLDFYAKQVSLALEHAALYTKEVKTTREQAEANKIGQEITAGATDKTPGEILEEVRGKISMHLDTNNFMAILIDEQANELDLHLHYHDGQMGSPARRPIGSGLEGWFLAREEALLIASDVAGFAQRNGIQLPGGIPSSWLGIPLRVNGKVIGGIILQKFQEKQPFIERDAHRLTLIADQVAGAIQNCRAAEKERQEMEKLNVLSRAGFEMLQVARENEENLWKAALTLATANFGVGFNRAMLFLLAEQTSLLGRAAIGTEDPDRARLDWKADELRHYTFDDFLQDLRARNLKLTDFDAIIQKIEIPLKGRADAFAQVMRDGEPVRVEAEFAHSLLPSELTSKINLSACAVLPLSTSKKVEGVVLVDNKHNGKPISGRDLDRLKTVLGYAGLIWETLREREKSENLLYANQEIMSRSGREELKHTLARICNAALGLSEADWNIIYPFVEHRKRITFDIENANYAGELKSGVDSVLTKKRPSPHGMTAHIIETGGLYISDVSQPNAKIGKRRIEDHLFVQSEGVRALIGMKIEDPYTHQPLGVFYMNFREPRLFSDLDTRHAESFASLAAFAISNARRMDEREQSRRLEAALETAQAVNSSPEQEGMLKNVLERLHRFFKETTLCVLTFDENEHSLKFAPGALEFYTISNPAYRRMRSFPLDGSSIACTVARNTLKSGKIEIINVDDVHEHPEYLGLIAETQSELCASLVNSEQKLLGVLALERRDKFGFNEDDKALVEMVAQQLSLGLERFKQREHIHFNKTVATMTAWAADLAHEINNEAGNIQTWAYLINEFTEDDSPINEYAIQIEESAQRLSAAGSWSDQGKLPIPLDHSLKKYAEPIARQLSTTFQMTPGATGIYINANPAQFQRVLRHLIRNAARAMSNRREKKIIIRTNILNPDTVEIQVQDFGPGVPERVRPFLLQTSITTKGRPGGYGLLISRQVVEEMDGNIQLLPTEPGKGAIFSIKLPIIKSLEAGVE